MLPVDFSRLYHTLRFLKYRQIRYQVWYRIRRLIRKNIGFTYPVSYPRKGEPCLLQPFVSKNDCLKEGNVFTFLNQTLAFNSWNEAHYGKLWSYNLNYMDYLHQNGVSFEEGKKWIEIFIDDIAENKDGLEPYPIALRGINWIKFISKYQVQITEEEKQRWDAALYAQYKILQNNLEYHLLGNHLLEDAFSLLWAGLYYRDEVFYFKATRLLEEELKEQILSDGGHYELSPMYHEILLDRLLDCVNVAKNNLRFSGQETLVHFLERKAELMLGWLQVMVYRDGSIPLFNDAALNVAPGARELFAYAQRLGLSWKRIVLKESGYRKFESQNFEWVIDVGQIGPDYIPGHAHADTFNYELRIQGRPFIIDTGISTYNPDTTRFYERSTCAHNTVTINNMNSSKVWGAFRVAERAHVVKLFEKKSRVMGVHDGFWELGIMHERIFSFSNHAINIVDQILGKTSGEIISRIIFHPDVQLLSVANDRILTNMADIRIAGALGVELEDVEVCFEYNKRCRTKSVKLMMNDVLEYSVLICS